MNRQSERHGRVVATLELVSPWAAVRLITETEDGVVVGLPNVSADEPRPMQVGGVAVLRSRRRAVDGLGRDEFRIEISVGNAPLETNSFSPSGETTTS